MARYKRRWYGRRRRSTNVIKMKFQSFMDISTSDSSMQIVTVSAGGPEILKRLAPQFGAYKYYKIGNIAVKLVPASTLPVDPTGLSYSAGEQTVDPRDQLTPGLMRITNGEDIFEDITGLSDTVQHAVYNNMLLDPRWFKWMLQSGVKRHATPRYWQIGQLHQDKWPGAIMNYPELTANSSGGDYLSGTMHKEVSRNYLAGTDNVRNLAGSSPYGFFQTGHRGVLGWLPTDGYNPVALPDNVERNEPMIASPPEVEVMKIILPKAYKVSKAAPYSRREPGIIIVCSLLRLCTLKSLLLTSVSLDISPTHTGLWMSSTFLEYLRLLSLIRDMILSSLLIAVQVVTMATIKVFDVNGVKELQCFDTLVDVPYLEEEEYIDDLEPKDDNPFE